MVAIAPDLTVDLCMYYVIVVYTLQLALAIQLLLY